MVARRSSSSASAASVELITTAGDMPADSTSISYSRTSGIREVGFHRGWHDGTVRQRLDREAIQARAPARPPRRRHVAGSDLAGQHGMGQGIKPTGDAARQPALINALAYAACATQ